MSKEKPTIDKMEKFFRNTTSILSKENTTIQISKDTKKLLDKFKVIPEESNESVLKRILAKQK